ncbi:MAG: hypothetical protein WCS20_13670 [Alphaproteobacteria bacterium]
MNKIALAAALSVAASYAFAGGMDQPFMEPAAALAPGGTAAVAGETVVIAGQTYTYTIASGLLLIALLASSGGDGEGPAAPAATTN